MVSKNCAHCGTPFMIRPQGKHAKFCSTACRVANSKQRKLEGTTLTLQLGKVEVRLEGLDPSMDKENLREAILAKLGPELISQVSNLESSPENNKRHPAVIVFEDGWTQQANLTIQEIISLPGTQRLVGNTLRTIEAIR